MTEPQKKKLIEDIRTKLTKSGWSKYLWMFWTSDEFSRIIDYLVKEADAGKRWCPIADKMFRWMEQCPVDKVKVVLLVDTVFNTPDTNSGIPYSLDTVTGINAAHKEVQSSMPGKDKRQKPEASLTWLTNQGVLIIPTAPTAMIERWGHHKQWSPLISYIINRFNKDRPEVPWVFIGTAEAHEYSDMVNTEKKHHLYTYKEHQWEPMWKQVNEWIGKSIKWTK